MIVLVRTWTRLSEPIVRLLMASTCMVSMVRLFVVMVCSMLVTVCAVGDYVMM